METIKAYHRQTIRKIIWLTTAVVTGGITGLLADVLEIGYPGWRVGLLVGGIVFFPWFIRESFKKDQVSTIHAIKAARELHGRPRE